MLEPEPYRQVCRRKNQTTRSFPVFGRLCSGATPRQQALLVATLAEVVRRSPTEGAQDPSGQNSMPMEKQKMASLMWLRAHVFDTACITSIGVSVNTSQNRTGCGGLPCQRRS